MGEGERLREAGSINKSLMVLGQCLEAMRTNQRKMAVAGALSGKGTGHHSFKLSEVTILLQMRYQRMEWSRNQGWLLYRSDTPRLRRSFKIFSLVQGVL
jgi:hypothetical protein